MHKKHFKLVRKILELENAKGTSASSVVKPPFNTWNQAVVYQTQRETDTTIQAAHNDQAPHDVQLGQCHPK